MALQIITGKPERVAGELVGMENDHLYQKPRPINDVFELALMAVMHVSDKLKKQRVMFDMGMTDEQAKAHTEVGVYRGTVGPWGITVNWTTKYHHGLPPHHIGIDYSRTEVAILCPYTDGQPLNNIPQVNVWKGRLHCGVNVSDLDLMEACAEVIPRVTGRSKLWEAFDGPTIEAYKRDSKEVA